MTRDEIDQKMDCFISELLEDAGVDNWYYISNSLDSISDFIKSSPSTMMTTDYKLAVLKNVMNKEPS